MKDQTEKKSISIVARKCETFVTSSMHDDGTRKLSDRIDSTGQQTGCI